MITVSAVALLPSFHISRCCMFVGQCLVKANMCMANSVRSSIVKVNGISGTPQSRERSSQ